MSQVPAPQVGPLAFGKNLLLFAMLCVAGVVFYKVLFNGGAGLLSAPQAVDLKYSDADFKFNLDEESTLRILTNPDKYKQEFDDLIYNFNLSMLFHVANRMSLPDTVRRQLEPLYKKQHEYLKSMYYADFVALKDTTDALYQTWYNDNANNAVRLFQEVSGKYTCFFVTQIIATALKTSTGRLMAKGKNVASPCDIAINEALKPMAERLAVKAAIYDFSASKGLLREKISREISELATFEQQDRKGINRQNQYKILGFNVSETDIEITAISSIKAGFKLDQYFDLKTDNKRKLVVVTLPPPKILSHEVYPKIDKIDVGWFSGIKGEEMNKMFDALRKEFRQEAIDDGVLEKSKKRAESLMQDLLGPVVRQMGKGWKIAVTYQNTGEVSDAPEPSNEPKTLQNGGKIIEKTKKKEDFVPPF
jgi:Protein of unknown function (DUF4230)